MIINVSLSGDCGSFCRCDVNTWSQPPGVRVDINSGAVREPQREGIAWCKGPVLRGRRERPYGQSIKRGIAYALAWGQGAVVQGTPQGVEC